MTSGNVQPLHFKLPALADATEATSATSQRDFLLSRATEFVALALAAALGALPAAAFHGVGPPSSLVLITAALVVRVAGFGDRAEKRWYDARAATESIKTAAWQFGVGGESYRLDDPSAQERFLRAQHDVLALLPKLQLPGDVGGAAVPDQLLAMRDASRSSRRELYLRDRIEDQRSWYSRNAKRNARRAAQWKVLLVAVEAAALILGLLRAVGTLDVDWIGILATAAASIGAWKQTKNHAFLSESYAVTCQEVTLVAASMGADTEGEWAQAVHDAEAAFSREHTLWLARRQGHPA